MNVLVERVAKAIFASDMKWAPVLEHQFEENKIVYLKAAHAAIEAMREPTPEMYIAAYAANGGKWVDDEYEPPPNVCWPAMIDAALAVTKPNHGNQ